MLTILQFQLELISAVFTSFPPLPANSGYGGHLSYEIKQNYKSNRR